MIHIIQISIANNTCFSLPGYMNTSNPVKLNRLANPGVKDLTFLCVIKLVEKNSENILASESECVKAVLFGRWS